MKGAFEQLCSFVLGDMFDAIAADCVGVAHTSKVPDSFWYTEVWTYRCLESHAGVHRGQDINNGTAYSFIAEQTYEFRSRLVEPADGVMYDVRKFELISYVKYHSKTGEIVSWG